MYHLLQLFGSRIDGSRLDCFGRCILHFGHATAIFRRNNHDVNAQVERTAIALMITPRHELEMAADTQSGRLKKRNIFYDGCTVYALSRLALCCSWGSVRKIY